MLYIYCALLAAYFPVWMVLLIRLIYGQTTKKLKNATELALLVVLINSTVNPGLYLWRIREIRLPAKELLRTVFLRRGTTENRIGSRNRVDTPSLELEIRQVEVGLENLATNEIFTMNRGSAKHLDVFTTHF